MNLFSYIKNHESKGVYMMEFRQSYIITIIQEKEQKEHESEPQNEQPTSVATC